MTLTAAAISFILLASGLATCGWRFLVSSRGHVAGASEGGIGRLLTSLFFLSAAYNGVLGLGSLLVAKNPAALVSVLVSAHVILTALAVLSVYTAYYIFWPQTSPRTLLGTIGVMGGVGLFHINTPLQLAPLLAANVSPNLMIITGSLLGVSAAAILFVFVQLFRQAESRATKILSAAVCGLTLASVAHMTTQLMAPYWNLDATGFNILEIALGLAGIGFLISMISTPGLRGAFIIFMVLAGSRLVLYFNSYQETGLYNAREIWSFAFQAIAVWGVYWGFKWARKQGGFKTPLGSAINLLTFGLVGQVLGHNLYYMYVFVLQTEVPYPGLPDIGYMASTILYIVAAIQLGRAISVNFNLKKIVKRQWLALVIPSAITVGYYFLTRNNFNLDWANPAKIVADFAYPVVGAFYLLTALYIYFSPQGNVNRAVRNTLLILFGALGMQYLADTLYTAIGQTSWINGSLADCTYFFAYFLMAVAIIKISTAPYHKSEVEKVPVLQPAAVATKPGLLYGVHGAIAIFAIFLGWWGVLYLKYNGNTELINTEAWPDVYNLMAVWGVWWGFKALKLWSLKTAMGKATALFTAGLFLQILGQIIFSIYFNFFGVEVPYPSFADIPYLGSPILYLFALIMLGKAWGVTYDLRKAHGLYLTLLFSIGILLFSGFAIGLGQNYTFDWATPLRIVLDFAYPLVESLYLIVFLHIYLNKDSSRFFAKVLLFVGAALALQYAADTLFTYLAANDLWNGGSPNELIYLAAYFVMALALIRTGQSKIETPKSAQTEPTSVLISAVSQAGEKVKNSWDQFADILKILAGIRNENTGKAPREIATQKPELVSLSKHK
jgi:hypothetical protein